MGRNLDTDFSRLKTRFCSMDFNSPITLLSGCVGFGQEYTHVKGFSHRHVGAVFLKGTTLEPRLGHPPPRLAEVQDGLLNAIGLQNPGVAQVIEQHLPALDFTETRFIANLNGSSVEEYRELAHRFDNSPIDAMEINISCPNVSQGGLLFGHDPKMTTRVVAACRAVTRKPLITKLSPNQTDIVDNARHCIEAGSDALSMINTITGMAVDIHTRRAMLSNNQGGLSGPAIKPVALLKVHQVYQLACRHEVPIIGQGGICTSEDVLEFIIAGASAVGIGTGLFYEPLLCAKINQSLCDYLQEHNIPHIRDLIGTLKTNEH